jgi:hypothetical protein
MKTLETSIFGQLPCPENFNELIHLIAENKKKNSKWNVSYWRGQSNIEWKIDSAAVRRLKHKNNIYPKPDDIKEDNVCWYEKELIEKARKNMFDFDSYNRRMSDLELLVKLQHHGAATRLVDFTKNALIALFFCAYDQKYQNNFGLLFGIDTNIIGGHEDDFDFSLNYDNLIANTKKPGTIYSISPPPISSRIAAQHAILLYSKYTDCTYGSLFLKEELEYYKFIAISPELKKLCNEYLTNFFDITRPTMFPDFTGFCEINSTDWGTGEHVRW